MECGTDWGVIITVVACLFAMLSVMIGLFLHLANKIDGFKKDLQGEIQSMRSELHTEMNSLRRDINMEIKDFHGRLCTIEERNKPSQAT